MTSGHNESWMDAPKISVIIPTLNAADEIDELLTRIESQNVKPQEVLVVDSSSDDATATKVSKYSAVKLVVISRSEFNHGSTRDMALRRTTSDFICFLTQDALPASNDYLGNLLAPVRSDEKIALVSGRQLPKPDARRFEQLVRSFNYPAEPSVRSKKDLPKYGIKTFFASDVCSAYRREAYLACGGFPHVDTNEDMFMAARFITNGWEVAYEPSAAVYHSHNLTPAQQYARNRVVGKFLEENANELMGISEVGEGGRLVKSVSSKLLHEGRIGEFCAFGIDCAARFLGNRAGRISARRSMKDDSLLIGQEV